MRARSVLISAISAFFTAAALFQNTAAAAGTEVKYTDGLTTLKGYFAPADRPKGAIVIIPEWWGLNDYAKTRANELAKLGYSTLAADMYGDGQTTSDPNVAKALSAPFYSDTALMVRRVQKGFDALSAQNGVDKNKIVVIGYCFGGTSALQFGISGGAAKGVAAFHGGLKIGAPADPAKVTAKFIVMEGEDDSFVPPEERAAFKKVLKDSKIDFTWIDYSGAHHGFSNPKADSYKIPGLAYSKSADLQSSGHLQLFLYRALHQSQ